MGFPFLGRTGEETVDPVRNQILNSADGASNWWDLERHILEDLVPRLSSRPSILRQRAHAHIKFRDAPNESFESPRLNLNSDTWRKAVSPPLCWISEDPENEVV